MTAPPNKSGPSYNEQQKRTVTVRGREAGGQLKREGSKEEDDDDTKRQWLINLFVYKEQRKSSPG